jgi:hypothetical protein
MPAEGVSQDQCERRINLLRSERNALFEHVQQEIRDFREYVEEKMDDLAKGQKQIEMQCLQYNALVKIEANKTKLAVQKEAAERTLKDVIIEYRFEILMILMLLILGGDNALAILRGLIQL